MDSRAAAKIALTPPRFTQPCNAQLSACESEKVRVLQPLLHPVRRPRKEMAKAVRSVHPLARHRYQKDVHSGGASDHNGGSSEQKDSGKPHYEIYTANITSEEMAAAQQLYAGMPKSYAAGRQVITKKNMLDVSFGTVKQHLVPLEPSILQVLHWLVHSGTHVPAYHWISTPMGQPCDPERVNVLWNKMILNPGNCSRDDAFPRLLWWNGEADAVYSRPRTHCNGAARCGVRRNVF